MDDTNFDGGPIADTACFHCQQTAEKYLKAFLEEHLAGFPRLHSLLPLLDLCLKVDASFSELRGELIALDGYAVAVRYPGVTATPEMAEAALAAARRVRRFIRTKLGLD